MSDPDLGTISIVFEVTVIATGLNAMFPDLPTILPASFDLTNTSKVSETTPVNEDPSPEKLVAVTTPVKLAPERLAFVAIELVTVVEKLASSPNAVIQRIECGWRSRNDACHLRINIGYCGIISQITNL